MCFCEVLIILPIHFINLPFDNFKREIFVKFSTTWNKRFFFPFFQIKNVLVHVIALIALKTLLLDHQIYNIKSLIMLFVTMRFGLRMSLSMFHGHGPGGGGMLHLCFIEILVYCYAMEALEC